MSDLGNLQMSVAFGIIIFVVYVDDIVIIKSDKAAMSSLKSCLYGQYQTMDLGILKYFSRVEVMKHKKAIVLLQKKYVLNYQLRPQSWELNHAALQSLNLQFTKDGDLFEDLEKYRGQWKLDWNQLLDIVYLWR